MINVKSTNERVRETYDSVAAFCRHYGVSSRNYYYTLNGKRGIQRSESEAKMILSLLSEEGLLVEEDGDVEAAS